MTVAEELERLKSLRESGSLSEVEYAQAKACVLGATATPPHNTFLHRLSVLHLVVDLYPHRWFAVLRLGCR